MKSISVQDLKTELDKGEKGCVLIDVREDFEHRAEAIPEAENMPAGTLDNMVPKLKKLDTVYVSCRTGGRSAVACQQLAAAGVNVVDVEGGLEAWKTADFDINKKGKAMPLMRQVMLVAGASILLGVLLGWFVNMYWFILAGAVGAGLTFAGLTGHCGLTQVLKHMPWNK